MTIDFLDESAPVERQADICIVGAGAAGIAMAHAFIGTPLTVCLIESGGYGGEERNQALYEGHSVGSPAFDPVSSRMRVFVGSCNLWGGGCMPLNAMDSSPRDRVPHSGWPLSPAELAPYYQRARAFCGIEAHALEGDRFLTPLKRPPVPFADTLVNRIFVRSPVLFGQAYRAPLQQAPNVTVLLHTNLLELEATPDGASELGIGAGDVAHAFARKLADKPLVRASDVKLIGYFEQAPYPASRITLGEQRDAFGQRKVRIDWRLTGLDRHTYPGRRASVRQRTGARLRRPLRARALAGRRRRHPAQVCGTAHHLGATRMADNPRQGVVGRHCRVHGMDNLYVAGSSVFPTGGWAFPTFTIVALSLRLADRLKMMCLA